MPSLTNTRIVMCQRPQGIPQQEHFRMETVEVPALSDGEVLVKSSYLSVDPYMRGLMRRSKSYMDSYRLGEIFGGAGIGEVVESRSSSLQAGERVWGILGWQEYSVHKAGQLLKMDPGIQPATAYLSILGTPGLIAYFGLADVCKPREGETLVVSSGAGAVGAAVGQIAKKIYGCHVVGITGSNEKVYYLKEALGFDEAINYRLEQNLRIELMKACPHGIDMYFDNVGGDISDAVFGHINDHARIAVCGQIALYNLVRSEAGSRILPAVLLHRAMVKGILIADYEDRLTEARLELERWLREGQLKCPETITEGLENTVDAFINLFSGTNPGKQLVRI
ncbi:NADP-dependent oxidoreductase [Paenibacillus sp. FSL R7-0179]|uniref:NADP-dependent oxidoreductase n=1 Tax=Paenibacillus sp. FSL R7-0179 TaxID=2921672 RepID=UPI0030FBA621